MSNLTIGELQPCNTKHDLSDRDDDVLRDQPEHVNRVFLRKSVLHNFKFLRGRIL